MIIKYIHNILLYFPFLKNILKFLIQKTFVFLGIYKENLPDNLLIIRPNSSFGFHDKCPWDKTQSRLLSYTYSCDDTEFYKSIPFFNIGYYDGENWSSFNFVSKTNACNWQQGCQLQWVDNDTIVFNDIKDQKYLSVSCNLLTNKIQNFGKPINSLSSIVNLYTTINYCNFDNVMPGYGYRDVSGESLSDSYIKIIKFSNESLFEYNKNNIPSNLLNSNKSCCISHSKFSPKGTYLCFFVRSRKSLNCLYSEMFLVKLSDFSIRRIPLGDIISHYTFLDENNILVYSQDNNSVFNYYRFKISDWTISKFNKNINHDGHPFVQCSTVVYDTYPNIGRLQYLYLQNKDDNYAKSIGSFYSPFKYTDTCRVDLHPRISPDSKFICCDSSFSNNRSLTTFKINAS